MQRPASAGRCRLCRERPLPPTRGATVRTRAERRTTGCVKVCEGNDGRLRKQAAVRARSPPMLRAEVARGRLLITVSGRRRNVRLIECATDASSFGVLPCQAAPSRDGKGCTASSKQRTDVLDATLGDGKDSLADGPAFQRQACSVTLYAITRVRHSNRPVGQLDELPVDRASENDKGSRVTANPRRSAPQ